MSFTIDTGYTRPIPKGWSVDRSQTIRFTDWTRADRTKRQIIEAIEEHENANDLAEYMEAESIVVDALAFFDDSMAADVDAAAKEHRDRLVYGACQSTAVPCNSTAPNARLVTAATKGKAMFDFDTGSSGSEGPWLQWSARGTQDGSVPAKSFFIREEGGVKTPTDAATRGLVLDIVNMKTGWQRSDGVLGQAPEWKWNASIAQMMPQPGDDYKRGFQMRVALGGGKSATWEQAGAAVWNSFGNLVPALQQGPGDGSLPLVRMTSVKEERFARGSTATPIFEVTKWVPRPDCLKEGTAIATDPTPAQPDPAPTPAPAGFDDEIGF